MSMQLVFRLEVYHCIRLESLYIRFIRGQPIRVAPNQQHLPLQSLRQGMLVDKSNIAIIGQELFGHHGPHQAGISYN